MSALVKTGTEIAPADLAAKLERELEAPAPERCGERFENSNLYCGLEKNHPGLHMSERAFNAQQAPITRQAPLPKAREWQLPFGPQVIKAGAIEWITQRPECLFRGEKLINQGADNLFIKQILVGARLQFPITAPPKMTGLFSSYANELRMDVCQPGLSISIQVENPRDEDLVFGMTLFGRAIL